MLSAYRLLGAHHASAIELSNTFIHHLHAVADPALMRSLNLTSKTATKGYKQSYYNLLSCTELQNTHLTSKINFPCCRIESVKLLSYYKFFFLVISQIEVLHAVLTKYHVYREYVTQIEY